MTVTRALALAGMIVAGSTGPTGAQVGDSAPTPTNRIDNILLDMDEDEIDSDKVLEMIQVAFIQDDPTGYRYLRRFDAPVDIVLYSVTGVDFDLTPLVAFIEELKDVSQIDIELRTVDASEIVSTSSSHDPAIYLLLDTTDGYPTIMLKDREPYLARVPENFLPRMPDGSPDTTFTPIMNVAQVQPGSLNLEACLHRLQIRLGSVIYSFGLLTVDSGERRVNECFKKTVLHALGVSIDLSEDESQEIWNEDGLTHLGYLALYLIYNSHLTGGVAEASALKIIQSNLQSLKERQQ